MIREGAWARAKKMLHRDKVWKSQLRFADISRERKQAEEEAVGAREAGRGSAERSQQARAAFGLHE